MVKVVEGPFHMRYVKQAGRLDVMARDMYVCSLGGEVEVGNGLPTGTYRVKKGGKTMQGEKRWIAIEGVEGEARGLRQGWVYGTGGARGGSRENALLMMQDAELAKLYNVVVEEGSMLVVEP